MTRRRTSSRAPTLASPASSFVGREADLDAIAARFEEGARLVTVFASGGMGKTRLALRYAERVRPSYERHGGSVHWVDVASAADRGALHRALAAAIDAELPKSRDHDMVATALGRALGRRKRALFVIDNVEQIGEAARASLEVWLRAAPDARFLVTSRAVLDVVGEHLCPLEPLDVPSEASTAALEAPAVELFLRRAREVVPSLDRSVLPMETLLAVVRRTDGIPLAIELAAARLSILSLEELAVRLSRPLEVLARRSDTGRHASMRRTVLDSMDTLSPLDRDVLELVALFRGEVTVGIVEDVAGACDLPRTSVLGAIDRLVARSLVRVGSAGSGSRLELFAVVREAAKERAAERPAWLARAEGAVLAVVARLAKEAARGTGPELPSWLVDDALALHAAATREGGDARRALDIALGLSAGSAKRGLYALVFELTDRALESPGLDADPRDVARGLVERGIARRELGDAAGALVDLEQGLARARALDDAGLEARSLTRIGEIVETRGQTAEAKRSFAAAIERAHAMSAGPERRLVEADARGRLGHTLRREGSLEAARDEIARALALLPEDRAAERAALEYEAGVVALFETRYAEAEASFLEGLDIAGRAAARHAEAALSSGYGVLLQETGRLDAAIEAHARSVHLFADLGSRHREASSMHYLACARLELGAYDEAAKLCARSLEVMRSVSMPRYEVIILGAWAVADASAGRIADAASRIAEAERALVRCASEPAMAACLTVRKAHVEAIVRGDLGDVATRVAAEVRGRENDDVRTALRQLDRASRGGPSTRALHVAPDGGSFTPPGAGAVDIGGRAPLKRILRALVDEHAEGRGDALSVDDLVRAGWPEERMSASSGANRVRVALATLRRLGLRDAIRTGHGGYFLDPNLDVRSTPSEVRPRR
jgi:predicted ATPase